MKSPTVLSSFCSLDTYFEPNTRKSNALSTELVWSKMVWVFCVCFNEYLVSSFLVIVLLFLRENTLDFFYEWRYFSAKMQLNIVSEDILCEWIRNVDKRKC